MIVLGKNDTVSACQARKSLHRRVSVHPDNDEGVPLSRTVGNLVVRKGEHFFPMLNQDR